MVTRNFTAEEKAEILARAMGRLDRFAIALTEACTEEFLEDIMPTYKGSQPTKSSPVDEVVSED